MTDDAKSTSAAPSTPPEEGDDPASARAKPLPLRLPVVPQDPPAPALIPARMINEVLYCERLLYLEYVQGEWADNVYTADGQAVHRRVNEQVKVLKPAPEEGTRWPPGAFARAARRGAMIRFAADEDFNNDVVRALRRALPEVNILGVREAGRGGQPDPEVLAWAAAEARVLLTHDVTTMTRHALERVARGEPMPGVIAVHQRLPIGDVVDDS